MTPAAHQRTRENVAVTLGFGHHLDVVLTSEESGERSPHEAGVLDE
ncbi:hypothetical protein [Streptomyces scabichelini]|nr:hypothetical protein [Streptomyces scabichelini]